MKKAISLELCSGCQQVGCSLQLQNIYDDHDNLVRRLGDPGNDPAILMIGQLPMPATLAMPTAAE